MKPLTVGIIAACAIIAAFIAGSFIEIESDGDVTIDSASDGPLEQAGEALDKATE
ncbi:hypothetical protein KHP62_01110 [Rhodobacteraceae bacterium NNCM2]|nr:hypothetical protein [Coraliihabitans acroporae]